MKKFIFCFLLLSAPTLFAHQENLKNRVIRADLASVRSEQKKLAEQALKLAETCVTQNPEEATCYYYRGQALGIYHGESFFGYVKRLRRMMADWKKTMELNPKLDHGGPYRMFAEVYIALPKYFGPKDLRQNLDKAIQYLEKSIKISDYPTNFLDLAEAHFKNQNALEARKALNQAKRVLPTWQNYPYYKSWQQTLSELDKKLPK